MPRGALRRAARCPRGLRLPLLTGPERDAEHQTSTSPRGTVPALFSGLFPLKNYDGSFLPEAPEHRQLFLFPKSLLSPWVGIECDDEVCFGSNVRVTCVRRDSLQRAGAGSKEDAEGCGLQAGTWAGRKPPSSGFLCP